MELNPIGVPIVFTCHAMSLFFLSPSRFKPAKTASVWLSVLPVVILLPFFLYRVLPNESGLYFGLYSTATIMISIAVFLSMHSVAKTLFLFLTYAHVFAIILYVSIMISILFFEGSEGVMIAIRTVLHISLVIVCLTVVRKRFYGISSEIENGWWPLNVLVFLFCISMNRLAVNSCTIEEVRSTILPFFTLTTMTIAVYWLFFYTIRYMNLAQKTERSEMQSEFLMRQVSDMEESMENFRRLRHDIRHHNMLIAAYAEQGENDELLRYLGQYEQEAENSAMVPICENLAANSILSAYTQKAKQQGIEVQLDVNLERSIIISDTDLVAILANLMENAIHGCAHSGKDHPFIELHIRRKVAKLIIDIRNSAGDDVKLENGLPRTKRGIGVSSILHSAAKYGGEYDFQIKDGVFSCQLLFQIN